MKYPGFMILEVWGDALRLPKISAAWGAALHMYKHCIWGVRIMSKFEEFEKHPEIYQKNTIDKANRAREIGKKVMLCLDWHNTANSMAGYHAYRYIPNNLPMAVAAIIRDVKPDIVQVANEPYYIKKGKKLRTDEYAAYVYEYVKGMKAAGFKGLMVAQQSSGENGDLHDAWEWHVHEHGYTYCAEGKHQLPRVLHEWKTAAAVLADLKNNAWSERSQPKGWKYPIFQDEFSAVGRGIHINSREGAKAMRVSLEFFKEKKAPIAWLTMGGSNPEYGGEGGWGMHTQLINSLGEVSKGGQEMLRFFGAPQYDGGDGPPPPPPDKIDMLELLAPSSVNFAKTGPARGVTSTIRDNANRIFTNVKSQGGTAWDWFYWDDEFIYHFMTEDGDWHDPTSFKTHVAPGVIWCKRFAKLGESHTSSPRYHRWANCTQTPAISLASARTTLHPRTYTAGELGFASTDLPASTVCYRLDWRWGPSAAQLETFTYAVGWGFLDWDLSGHNVHPVNLRSSKPLTQPVFTCFNVPEWVDENLRQDESPPPPPPDGEVPPGGWNTIRTPRSAYMKMTNEQIVENYNRARTGNNHMITKECAVEQRDLPSVEQQLKAIIDSW